MDKVNLIQYGLQRSGTNYTRALIENNFSNVLFHNNEYTRSLPLQKHFRLHSNMNFVPEPKYLHNFKYETFADFDSHVKRISEQDSLGYIVTVKEPYSWYISIVKKRKRVIGPNFQRSLSIINIWLITAYFMENGWIFLNNLIE